MPKLMRLNDIKDDSVLDDIFNSEITVLEDIQGSKIYANWNGQQFTIKPKNLNAELLALMVRTAPMDANMNYRYYMEQTASGYVEKFQPRTNPFLNPFNWAKFFRDLKRNKK